MIVRISLLCASLLLPGLGQVQAAINVFTCEPEWAALAKELGGDRLDIYSATTALQDPHHIQARPSLIARARKADLLLCTGAGLETGWLPLLLRKAGNARIQDGHAGHFFAAEYVDMLEVPEKLDRSLGDIHASGNPHIHTDPRNIARVAGQLHQRLIEIDPDHTDTYGKHYEAFERDWHSAINKWSEQAAIVSGANVVVHHDYWSYLIKWLGLNKLATLEPLPGVSPTTSHLSQVKQLLENQKAVMIIETNYMNDRPVRWLAEQTKLPVVTLQATVDYQGGETLYHWFDGLVELIREPVK
jgi:zinc/manganese transport system substrate-binding protein